LRNAKDDFHKGSTLSRQFTSTPAASAEFGGQHLPISSKVPCETDAFEPLLAERSSPVDHRFGAGDDAPVAVAYSEYLIRPNAAVESKSAQCRWLGFAYPAACPSCSVGR